MLAQLMNQVIQARNIIRDTLVYLFAAMFSVLGGLLASKGDTVLVALFVGTLLGIFLLSRPAILLWFVILGGLVVAGLAQLYAPQFQLIRWSIALMSIALGLTALLDYTIQVAEKGALPSILWWLTAFLALTIVSSLFNQLDIRTFILGFKGYFQVWGLFFAIVLMSWSSEFVNRIPRALIWLAFLQLPFVLHQYIFVVPTRVGLGHGVVAEDVIAGTLGASATGGGANAVLSALLLIVISILTSFWKRDLLSSWRLLIAVLILIFPILVNLSKISLVYILLIYIILFWDELLKRPARFLIAGIFSMMLIFAIMTSYTLLTSKSDPSMGWKDFVRNAVEQNVSEGYGSLELNRWTSVAFWFEEEGNRPMVQTLLGYGLGASREGGGGVGAVDTLAQKKYPGMGIGFTTIPSLLWDTGVMGLVLILGAFGAAFRTAGKLVKVYRHDPWMASVFHGLQVSVAILALSLFHKNTFVFHLTYQTLVMLIFGYIAYWQKKALAIKEMPQAVKEQPERGLE